MAVGEPPLSVSQCSGPGTAADKEEGGWVYLGLRCYQVSIIEGAKGKTI